LASNGFTERGNTAMIDSRTRPNHGGDCFLLMAVLNCDIASKQGSVRLQACLKMQLVAP
jgi:hypothetical protein